MRRKEPKSEDEDKEKEGYVIAINIDGFFLFKTYNEI